MLQKSTLHKNWKQIRRHQKFFSGSAIQCVVTEEPLFQPLVSTQNEHLKLFFPDSSF